MTCFAVPRTAKILSMFSPLPDPREICLVFAWMRACKAVIRILTGSYLVCNLAGVYVFVYNVPALHCPAFSLLVYDRDLFLQMLFQLREPVCFLFLACLQELPVFVINVPTALCQVRDLVRIRDLTFFFCDPCRCRCRIIKYMSVRIRDFPTV